MTDDDARWHADDAAHDAVTDGPSIDEEAVKLLEGIIHQLSTDSDLDAVTAPEKYRRLLSESRRVLALFDPDHPLIGSWYDR